MLLFEQTGTSNQWYMKTITVGQLLYLVCQLA
jgi:hypothetical protein